MTRADREPDGGRPSPGGEVAIIGMACIFPGARNLDAYWHNIVSGVDAITDVPPGRWDPATFFDPDSHAEDKLYCKRGGYLRDLEFDPLEYGVMPIIIEGGDPDQFLGLRVGCEALADAGYAARPFQRDRTEVILGRGNYGNRGYVSLAARTLGIEQTLQILQSLHSEYTAEDLQAIKRELKASLPHFGPDTAGSLIPNLVTGRLANRLDLMGPNFTVDAACASALIAVDLAVRALLTGRCDLALVGGTHLATQVPFLVVFSQLNALSRRSQIRPFDEHADGTLPGEGVGVVVLKRRADAEQDGDRIYAIIRGVGTSSDGRGEGLLHPRVEGEELAVRRAYEMASIAPETVELIEAHGTGTPVGDLAEMQALTRVFGPRAGRLPTCAVGSVKSMIGHLMPAAGIAGLIKAALALYHRVLPPTLHCETPNPKFRMDKTPFYVNTEARPWIHGALRTPRRAGVNAFGFGGVNAHVILEEFPPGADSGGASGRLHWETEVCLLWARSREDLVEQVRRVGRHLETSGQVHLRDLAYTLNTGPREGTLCLALVSSCIDDLRDKLERARECLSDSGCREIVDVRGVYFSEQPLCGNGKLVFLFPGEESLYPNMLKDLCIHLPVVRAFFDRTDQVFRKAGSPLRPSLCTFPPSRCSDAGRMEMERELRGMGAALATILTADLSLYGVLRLLEIRPDALLGHGSGEYAALIASGCMGSDDLLLERLVELSSVYERVREKGKGPVVASAAREEKEEFLEGLILSSPEIEIYSATMMSPYPREPWEIRSLVADHWSRPGDLRGTIEALYHAGARIFVEVGPGDTLTACVADILRGRAHLAMACDGRQHAGITQLHHLIGALAAQGVSMGLDHLYKIRGLRRLPLDTPPAAAAATTQRSSVPLSLDLPSVRLSPERVRARSGRRPTGTIPDHTRGSTDSISHVMQDHLRTMERFLAVQQEVMATFMGGAGPVPARGPSEALPATSGPSLPFIGKVTSLTPGQEIVIVRRIDPEEDIFLRDHTFGFEVSDFDEGLKPLPIMPFTMCMEIMAEAAASVMPGKVLTGMREVLVRQWIAVSAPMTLEIAARRGTSGDLVEVKIRNLGRAAAAEGPGEDPLAEATAIFADAYPAPPPIALIALASVRLCRHTAAQMYEERLMFHGPRFQKVASLERSGDNGIVGHLQVSPPTDLFRSLPIPPLVIDPVLLDAAGQMLGYWAAERLESGYTVLPVRLVALEIFKASRWELEQVRCEVEVQQVTSRQVRATMNLFSPDGQLRLRLVGWEDVRSFWPREFYDFFRFPRQHLLTKAWDLPIASFPSRRAFASQRLDLTWETTRPIVRQALAHVILSRAERAEFTSLRGPEARRTEWLFGRATAKDAVRWLLRQREGINVCPADIEIAHDPCGHPFARIAGLGGSVIVPAISIAHSDGLAVAIAGYCSQDQRLGVDIERIRPHQETFQRITFTEGERWLLDSLPAASREEWVTRLWCAKEAVAKAIGKGFGEGPRSVLVQKLDARTGRVEIVLEERLAREFPDLGGVPLLVYTARDEDWAVASTLCERGEALTE